MTADPNGWPDKARKKALLAAATRMRDACQWGGPPEDWLHEARAILHEDFADLIAARVAEARNKALDEATAVARRVPIPGECSPAEAHGRMTGALAAAEAIRALKEQSHDR